MKLSAGLSGLAILTGIAAAMTSIPAGNRAEAALCPQYVTLSCVVEKNGFRHDAWTNACFAKEEGLRYLHVGACQGPICSAIYAPVCSITPAGKRHTYANQCLSDVADAILVHKGRCKR
jgi:hypothetical protein